MKTRLVSGLATGGKISIDSAYRVMSASKTVGSALRTRSFFEKTESTWTASRRPNKHACGGSWPVPTGVQTLIKISCASGPNTTLMRPPAQPLHVQISVIGGGICGDEAYELARDVGRLLGKRGHTVVCGGKGGVMEAACEGAKSEGGHTIGILPGERRTAANDYVDTAIATSLGHGRNHLVVLNGAAVIAIDGGGGTLSEIGFAHVHDRPIAGLGTHPIESVDGIEDVESPREAVAFVEDAV